MEMINKLQSIEDFFKVFGNNDIESQDSGNPIFLSHATALIKERFPEIDFGDTEGIMSQMQINASFKLDNHDFGVRFRTFHVTMNVLTLDGELKRSMRIKDEFTEGTSPRKMKSFWNVPSNNISVELETKIANVIISMIQANQSFL